MYNSQFTVAIHLLTLIACDNKEGCGCDSEEAAKSVNTNPVVVRRVLGVLREAGIVTSKSGRGGGWQLAKKPENISLEEIYRVLAENEPIFAMHAHTPSNSCLVGKHITSSLSKHYLKAEDAMRKELSKTTILDILKEVRRAESNE